MATPETTNPFPPFGDHHHPPIGASGSPLFSSISYPLAESFSLPLLPRHFPFLIFSLISCISIQSIICPAISTILFPNTYPKLCAKTKFSWNIRFVSSAHALLVVPLAFGFVTNPPPTLRNDLLFAYDPKLSNIAAISTGYFLWDAAVSSIEWLKYGGGVGFVVHGVGCVFVFGNSFSPFALGFGPIFLLWEISTVFLNPHWYLDKLNMTGSTLQLINGACLIGSFFITRNIVGVYQSFKFQKAILDELMSPEPRCSVLLGGIYAASNAALNVLNVLWFFQMIAALRKRFRAPPSPKGKKIPHARRESIAEQLEDQLAELDGRNPVPWTSGEESGVDGLKEE